MTEAIFQPSALIIRAFFVALKSDFQLVESSEQAEILLRKGRFEIE